MAIYFANKGFELSDETFYLYFSDHYNSEIYLTQNFGVLNKFACFGNCTIINLRIAKLIYQIIAVAIFVFSLINYLQHKNIVLSFSHNVFVFVILMMGSFVNYDYLPMTLSYNTWTLILSLLGFSLILFELTYKTKNIQLFSALGIGFFVFCLFLVKFPNSIIMVAVYGMVNVLFNRTYWLIKISLFFIGIGLSYLIFIHDYPQLLHIINNYKIALFDVKHMSTDNYLNQFKYFFNLCSELGYFNYLLFIALLTAVIKKFNKSKRQIWLYIPLFINFSVAVWFFKGNSQTLYNDFIVGSLLLFNIFIYLFFNPHYYNKLFQFSETNIISILLILMPLALMLGTNNQFYYTTSQTMCFSMSGAIILFFYNSKIDNYYLSLTTLFVCGFIFSVNYYGAVKTPYRQTSLLKKNMPIYFHPSIDGIYESREKFIDYTTLNLAINKLSSSNKKIVTFFNYMGLYYISNKKLFPETPLSDAVQNIEINKYILTRENFNNSFELIIIPSTVYNNPEFNKMFEQYGIYLGNNYKLKYIYTFLSAKETVYFYKKV